MQRNPGRTIVLLAAEVVVHAEGGRPPLPRFAGLWVGDDRDDAVVMATDASSAAGDEAMAGAAQHHAAGSGREDAELAPQKLAIDEDKLGLVRVQRDPWRCSMDDRGCTACPALPRASAFGMACSAFSASAVRRCQNPRGRADSAGTPDQAMSVAARPTPRASELRPAASRARARACDC